MTPKIHHTWDLTESEARALQNKLAAKVIKEDRLDKIRYVAGVDVAYEKYSDRLVAAVVILDAGSLEVVETVTSVDKVRFPYIPGLFSFRELPPLVKAFAKLRYTPDLVVCDAHGIAHPRRFGLACHLGIMFDIPTIGCAKTGLIGEHGRPGSERGSFVPLILNHEVIGHVLRTQDNINPVYVSLGHRISLITASDWILKLSPTYRLPETTQQADQMVSSLMHKPWKKVAVENDL